MHYDFDIEIPAITPETDPLIVRKKVCYGILRYHWESQIFPTNVDGDYAYDNYAVEFEEYYPILEVPYELTLRLWNDDDTFNHTISFMFLILHPTTIGRPELRPTSEEELTELLGEYEMAGEE